MYSLNLPYSPIKISGTRQHPKIFDVLRQRWVSLTPEEWVRQQFVHFLITHKGYPDALMANEISLKVGEKTLRADSVVYDRTARPIVIIEYKAPEIAITQKVIDQISVYNLLLHADYLIVSNGINHYCCRMDYSSNSYTFLEDIPAYEQICEEDHLPTP